MCKQYILAIFLFIFNLSLSAQSLEAMKRMALNRTKIRIVYGDTIADINIIPSSQVKSPNIHVTYFYYINNEVKRTQGAFTGKLLNGEYSRFNRNMALLEKGLFKRGIKKGEWMSWYENGSMSKVEYWKNSLRQKKFIEYYENGKVKRQGNYRNDYLHGKIFTYDLEGKKEVLKYKAGVLKQKSKNKAAKKAGDIIKKAMKIRVRKKPGKSSSDQNALLPQTQPEESNKNGKIRFFRKKASTPKVRDKKSTVSK